MLQHNEATLGESVRGVGADVSNATRSVAIVGAAAASDDVSECAALGGGQEAAVRVHVIILVAKPARVNPQVEKFDGARNPPTQCLRKLLDCQE
jgi:hypothetical protein